MRKGYDVIVIGLGHAGCEAALAAARLGADVLALTLRRDSIARMSCNPSIGGPGKSQLVREIDALGGEMGSAADDCYIHVRMLNSAKGPAVRAIRAQIDKASYQARMAAALESQPGLEVAEAELERVHIESGRVTGATIRGEKVSCRAVVLCSGTYLGGKTYIGEDVREGGPEGFPASALTPSLLDEGIRFMRFKTGTSPRIASDSIDYGRMELQPGEDLPYCFSNIRKPLKRDQEDCWITYTNERTHAIIGDNIDRAPIFSGLIKGVGPRYCPSIEAKVVRFAGKHRHQLFVEPITRGGREKYVAGLATSLPRDVQDRIVRTIPGLEGAVITKYGYAIEYDCVDPSQLDHRLGFRHIEGLFSAGQSNGSSGYEEAAAQGLVAGANAALWIKGCPPLLIGRDQAYMGVLVDDLVMKGTDEPYRMLTARAEYRLALRQDNADMRLTSEAVRIGLADDARKAAFEKKLKFKEALTSGPPADTGSEAGLTEEEMWLMQCVKESLELDGIYGGYIEKERRMAAAFRRLEQQPIPEGADYKSMYRLSAEAREKLFERRPSSIGEAYRIPGISPSDIAALIIHLRQEANPDGRRLQGDIEGRLIGDRR